MTATVTASDLLGRDYPPIRWVVSGLVGEGCTILAGKPKAGKSWLGLCVGLAVASGSVALGSLAVNPGEVLYLALEDGPRRLQARLRDLLAGAEAPSGLHLATEWPSADAGGLRSLIDWLDAHPFCRLVVIDTLKRWRPAERFGDRLYNRDYDALSPLADLARARSIAILVIWHLRKLDSADPLDLVSGSTGLTAAADAVLVLRRSRGSADGTLAVVCRDAPDSTLAMHWDAPRWVVQGSADEVRQSDERKAIVALLHSAGRALTPREVADHLGRNRSTIRNLLVKMMADGQAHQAGQRYTQ